jgi:hypothetical protein
MKSNYNKKLLFVPSAFVSLISGSVEESLKQDIIDLPPWAEQNPKGGYDGHRSINSTKNSGNQSKRGISADCKVKVAGYHSARLYFRRNPELH